MRGITTELKGGLFALIVLAILTFMTFKVGGIDLLSRNGYVVYIYFKNIAGLDEKTKVKIAGVNAGMIERIELHDVLAGGNGGVRLILGNGRSGGDGGRETAACK